MLNKWKANAEYLAEFEMKGGVLSPEMTQSGVNCPHCDTFCKDGVSVCVGCHSNIYYGSTPRELLQDKANARSLGFFISIFVLSIPDIINSLIGTTYPSYWGTGILFVVFFCGCLVFVGGEIYANWRNEKNKLRNPMFVRNVNK